MAIATLLPMPRAVFYDALGKPLAGGFVYTYVPGGTTPAMTWQDAGEATPNENPIRLDANGSCLLYGAANYQITVTDSLGNQVPAYSGLTAADTALAAMVPAVPTIAALQAETSSTLPQSQCYVLGYTSAADGGEGPFIVGTTAAANGGTIINDASGRSWHRDTGSQIYSAKWFGAVGNGTTNDSSAIQAALTASGVAGGGIVYLPPTGAAYLLNTGLTVPAGVKLMGAGTRNFPGSTATIAQWTAFGTWIQSTDTVNSAVLFDGHGCAVDGVNFIYAQPVPSGSFTPNLYPYAISNNPSGAGDFCNIENVMIIGASNGVAMIGNTTSGGGTGCNWRNLLLSCFERGMYTDFVNDTMCIDNVHVRNLYYDTTASVVTYLEANCIGWQAGYTDNPMCKGIEFLQCFVGIYCTTNTVQGFSHSLFNCLITDIQFNLCVIAIDLSGQAIVSGNITNCLAQSDFTTSQSATLFQLQSDNIDLSFSALTVQAGGSIMQVGGGASGRVTIGDLKVVGWSQDQTNDTGFIVNAGESFTLGARTITKPTGAGQIIAGAGSGSVNTPYAWSWAVYSAASQWTFTGTGITSFGGFSLANEYNARAYGVIQGRITGHINVTTAIGAGVIDIQLQFFPEIFASGIPASATGTIAFDSGWLDLTDGSDPIGTLQIAATAGVVVANLETTVLLR